MRLLRGKTASWAPPAGGGAAFNSIQWGVNEGSGTTIDITGISISSGTTYGLMCAMYNSTLNSVTIDPGGNDEAFTVHQNTSNSTECIACASIAAANTGTYTVRLVFSASVTTIYPFLFDVGSATYTRSAIGADGNSNPLDAVMDINTASGDIVVGATTTNNGSMGWASADGGFDTLGAGSTSVSGRVWNYAYTDSAAGGSPEAFGITGDAGGFTDWVNMVFTP